MNEKTIHDLKEANLKIKILLSLIEDDPHHLKSIENEAQEIIRLCKDLQVRPE